MLGGSRNLPASTVCGHHEATSESAVRAWQTQMTLSWAAIQFPVGAECDRQFGQNASPLQFERLVMTVYIHCVYSRFNALPISSFRSSMCSMPSEKRSMLG